MQDGVQGLLVEPEDATATGLSKALITALHKFWDVVRLIAHAHSYSWDTVAAQLFEQYKKTGVAFPGKEAKVQ